MLFKVSLLAAVASVVSAQGQLIINTPTALIQCQPYAVTWSGGDSSQYFVSVLPGGQGSAAAIETLGDQPTTATTYTWVVNIAAGTSVTLRVIDAAGAQALTAPVTIQQSSIDTCLGTSAGGSSGSASASAPASSGSSAASAASSASSVVASASSAASSVASSAASSASSVASSATTAITASSSAAASSAAGGNSMGMTASGSAPSPSTSPTSGAGIAKVGVTGLALAGAAALAVLA
ncbi:hypothetical protein OIV83_005316 [Microbotryomycetes sp. JL201]|nr:hypothetical protein OIV83_005316 [Microbotryomycetes sp. JL201]